MEFEYSPHHSPGNAPHLLSPKHMHGGPMDGFASIREIRRSLSYSPSKPQRYMMTTPRSPNAPKSPNAPASPSLLSRGQTTDIAETPKPRHSVKRNPSLRAASRRISPNSPLRRALSDNTNQANVIPARVTRRRSSEEDQENMAYTTSAKKPEDAHLHLHDKWLAPAKQEHASPMKSSPLKRSDGVMNLEAAGMGSPRSVKRRSLGAPLASDFNIFDQGFDGATSDSTDSAEEKDANAIKASAFATGSGGPAHQSPQRRASHLRRTTLQQRTGAGRTRLFSDAAKDSGLSQKLGRAGSRMSLDGALPMRSFDMESPFKRADPNNPPILFPRPGQKQYQSAPKAHPLSQALTPSSSNSSMPDEQSSRQQTAIPSFSKPPTLMLPPAHARSLPVGSVRPTQVNTVGTQASQSSQESFETPEGSKMTEALPRKAYTTGLMSKRLSNMDAQGGDLYGNMHMPDTPSKKAHFNFAPPNLSSSTFNPAAQTTHEFGSPSTPFGTRSIKISPQGFGKGSNIFGTRVGQPQLTRRGSFIIDDCDNSPTHRLESQSSNDDLPPTPTKSTSTNGRPDSSKGKSNSLRSSLFGRRTSLAPDTFASPAANEQQPEDVDSKSLYLFDMPTAGAEKDVKAPVDGEAMPSFTVTGCDTPTPTPTHGRSRSLDHPQPAGSPSPLAKRSQRSLPALHHVRPNIRAKRNHRAVLSPTQELDDGDKSSPHTPQDYFAPPDPSSLSISAAERPRTSMGGSKSIFPPATPTGPRDNGFSSGFGAQSSSFFANEVDTSLTERFGQITVLGTGEFSQVYRVSKPHPNGPAQKATPGRPDRAWAVKKSRKPYTGNRDRQRKMREVEILKHLRGHEHLAEFVDVWEAKNYLYIQTDFYENGNLKDFLWQHGAKGRLDDFRIWKVLLELSQGLKSIHDANYMHLDLKPANVFVDWEGCLKIGDFGLASSWPAPPHLDGEGDREYIGPEVLHGRFDKPADIFALGMIMLEIAGNVTLPDNGASWQRLRAGDMSDLPSLSWSSDTSLLRDESGEILNDRSEESLCASQAGDDGLGFLRPDAPKVSRNHELVTPPNFMIDRSDPQALDNVVQWMILPEPDQRPTVAQLLACGGVLWVESRRRAGATIWEGNWGPADDVLCRGEDVEMMDI